MQWSCLFFIQALNNRQTEQKILQSGHCLLARGAIMIGQNRNQLIVSEIFGINEILTFNYVEKERRVLYEEKIPD